MLQISRFKPILIAIASVLMIPMFFYVIVRPLEIIYNYVLLFSSGIGTDGSYSIVGIIVFFLVWLLLTVTLIKATLKKEDWVNTYLTIFIIIGCLFFLFQLKEKKHNDQIQKAYSAQKIEELKRIDDTEKGIVALRNGEVVEISHAKHLYADFILKSGEMIRVYNISQQDVFNEIRVCDNCKNIKISIQ